ncbi:SHC-transforming protein 1 isoform X2 [Aplysia californica]|uniref:SHC-transforming protein 1 isoform X2 n=1 Tax=Aplysia californica TaxID=6500 RepID=A0ABM0JC87_APLCA|nr:SHC-transforming protein 1 isoform X2 [Aplysia californica]
MDKLKKKNNKGGVSNNSTSEWSRTGSFMNKPDIGWIHPDAQLSPDAGICYGVRYIGCLEIKESMKTLDFDTRTTIARESINRVAEAAGLKTASKKKKIDRRLGKMMGDLPHMQYAGSNVNLTITTDSINLMVMESGEIIADHPLHVVSFASGGDVDTLDFVSYVAKDPEYGRACHVLECGGGLAEDVVTTIGQAFELRFKQYLKKQPKAVQLPDRQDNPGFEDEKWGNADDYYNDNPDAIAPVPGMEAAAATPVVPPRPELSTTGTHATVKEDQGYDEPKEDAAGTGGLYDNKAKTNGEAGMSKVEGVEYDNRGKHLTEQDQNSQIDAFDMEPFSVDLPPPPVPVAAASSKKSHKGAEMDLRENKSPSTEALEPVFEEWYHGDLPRKQAESMLEFDGDFLVRKSSNSPGQFVLSGKQAGAPRHLLLVDPEGIVRTRDFIFDSVSHLINYHRQNNLPIVTQGSELQLVRPVKTSLSAI